MRNNCWLRRLGSTLGVLAAAWTMLLVGAHEAAAQDRIHLRSGEVVEGKIKQELDGYLWVLTRIGGIETEVVYRPSEITRIERDVVEQPSERVDARPPRPSTADRPASAPRTSNAPRAAVLSLGESGGKDMVGLFMTAESIRRVIPMLEEDGVEILVLRINSGGGALLEIERLSDLIEYELKPKFRVVAWIESAISAAAMTAHAVEEIYFMSRGNYGACTGWYGQLQAVQGRELEEVLYMMERISARGKYDPQIMRSMQIPDPLSASIDANGEVTWYQNQEGEILVNPEGRILTFNAVDAQRLGFSRGTADTIEELARVMRLPEVEWVGERIEGVPYPVSRAERAVRQFRQKTYEDQNRTNEYFMRYNMSINIAQSRQTREERGRFVNQARQALNLMKQMVRNNPNFTLFVFNMLTEREFNEWVEAQERLLRDLMR